MGLRGILLLQQLLVGAIILAAFAASEPNSSCSSTCGSLHIPYPFGTGTREGCNPLDPSFLITCNHTSEKLTPFLGGGNLEVLNISLDGELRVSGIIASDCPNKPGYVPGYSYYELWVLKYFIISYTRNKFTAVGCDVAAYTSGSKGKELHDWMHITL